MLPVNVINELLDIGGQLGVVTVFALVGAGLFKGGFRWGWFLAALGLYVLYDGLLTRCFFSIPSWPADANWNWLGKVMSFAGMLLIASLPVFGFRKVGISFEQRSSFRTPLIVFLLLMGLIAYFAATDSTGRADLETIAFQWTMPSFDEELFYRGVLLVAMNEAFPKRVSVLGAPIGYGGLLTSLLFGLAHGMSYASSGFELDAMTILVTGGPSLLLLWFRERTGSLVLPVLGHSASNGLFTIV